MYLGIDIGGTKTLVAIFDDSGQLGQTVKFPTNHDYQQFLTDLKAQVATLGVTNITAGAVGAAGRHDRENGVIISCGNLTWKNVPLKHDLEALFNCPFSVENDAKVGGLAEAILVINDFKNVLYLPIGTGIGVAYIANGKIDPNIGDAGGSGLLVEYEDRQQTWEEIASGKAIVARYGKKASEITDPEIWKEISHRLCIGITELLAVITPDVIIIGGGVGTNYDKFGDYVTAELKQQETPNLPVPPLRPAQNPEQAVIYGCYELIKQHSTNGKTA